MAGSIGSVDLSGPISALGMSAQTNSNKAAQFYQAALTARQIKQQQAQGVGSILGAVAGGVGGAFGGMPIQGAGLGASIGGQVGGATQGAPINASQVIGDASSAADLAQKYQSNSALDSMLKPQVTGGAPATAPTYAGQNDAGFGLGPSTQGVTQTSPGTAGTPGQMSILGMPVTPDQAKTIGAMARNPQATQGILGALQFMRMQGMQGKNGSVPNVVSVNADNQASIPGSQIGERWVQQPGHTDDKGMWNPGSWSKVADDPSQRRTAEITDPHGNTRTYDEQWDSVGKTWKPAEDQLATDEKGQPIPGQLDYSKIGFKDPRAISNIVNSESEQHKGESQHFLAGQNAYSQVTNSFDQLQANGGDPTKLDGPSHAALLTGLASLMEPTKTFGSEKEASDWARTTNLPGGIGKAVGNLFSGAKVEPGQLQQFREIAAGQHAQELQTQDQLNTGTIAKATGMGVPSSQAKSIAQSVPIREDLIDRAMQDNPRAFAGTKWSPVQAPADVNKADMEQIIKTTPPGKYVEIPTGKKDSDGEPEYTRYQIHIAHGKHVLKKVEED